MELVDVGIVTQRAAGLSQNFDQDGAKATAASTTSCSRRWTDMDSATVETMVRAHCRHLHLPSVGARCMSLEAEAPNARLTHSAYLAALLEQELEDRAQRRAERRIAEARFPQVKRLSDFRFEDAPTISPSQISQLADGDYIDRAENVLFVWRLGHRQDDAGDSARRRRLRAGKVGALHHRG